MRKGAASVCGARNGHRFAENAGIRLRYPANVLGFEKPSSLADRGTRCTLAASAAGGARVRGRNRFAFFFLSTRKKNISRTQFANWVQQVSTGHLHLRSFDSGAGDKKRERQKPLSFFGAGNRNRTGTLFTARDFKSLVSTYSTMPASFRYRSTIFPFRQGERGRKSKGRIWNPPLQRYAQQCFDSGL